MKKSILKITGTIVYLAVLIFFFIKVDSTSHSVSDTLIGMLIPFILTTAALIIFLLIVKRITKPNAK